MASPGPIDTFNVWQIAILLKIQRLFKGYDDVMVFASHCGDPRNAFLVYFPVAYFCQRRVGLQVMLAAVMSEWLNALLKWMMYGGRPYWWIHTSGLYEQPPPLQQYPVTCETGPGTPSGHAMVTSAVWFVMVDAFATYCKTTWKTKWAYSIWVVYATCLVPVALSRLFIATHFPHQVVLGTMTGVCIGYVIRNYTGTSEVPAVRAYMASGVFVLLSGPGITYLMHAAGLDPSWSVELAKKWCARPEWIYLDTTPFFALTRDGSSILGMGAALFLLATSQVKFWPTRLWKRLLLIAISVGLARGLEHTHIPSHNIFLFYFLAFLRYFCLTFVITIMPRIMEWIVPQTKQRSSKNS